MKEEVPEEFLPGAGATGVSEATRAAVAAAGAREGKADGASETTRAAVAAAGVQVTLAGKQETLVVEEIQARAAGATGDVDPTPAFFIRLILRVLWRRVPR
ncbi:MAG: hypothetical protein CND84_01890 [Marine Group II euryarchaeote MED-G35]|nr:MAG: hypothetical protein CND84_01890 [Marine Group II euryarchaeote MED-G35]